MTATLGGFFCPNCRDIIATDDFQERYSTNLRRILDDQKVPPHRLALMVGTNSRTVERWLRAETVPHLGTAMKVYVVLGRPSELDLGIGHTCPGSDNE